MKIMLISFIVAASVSDIDLEATTAKLQEMTTDRLLIWAGRLRDQSRVNALLYQSFIC